MSAVEAVDVVAVAVVVIGAVAFLVSRFVSRRHRSASPPVVMGKGLDAAVKRARAKQKATS